MDVAIPQTGKMVEAEGNGRGGRGGCTSGSPVIDQQSKRRALFYIFCSAPPFRLALRPSFILPPPVPVQFCCISGDALRRVEK